MRLRIARKLVIAWTCCIIGDGDLLKAICDYRQVQHLEIIYAISGAIPVIKRMLHKNRSRVALVTIIYWNTFYFKFKNGSRDK